MASTIHRLAGVSLVALGALVVSYMPRLGGSAALGADNEEPDNVKALDRVLSKLDQVLKQPGVTQAVQKVDKAAERTIRETVRTAPGHLWDQVTSVAIDAATKMGDPAAKARLSEVQIEGRRSNIAEVRQGLDKVGQILSRSPAVKKLTNQALDVLERQGFLGRGVLSDLALLLGAAGAGYAISRQQLKTGEVRLVTRGASLSFTKTGDYAARIRIPNPAWPKQAVSLALTGVVPTKKGRKKGTEAEPVQRAEVAVPFPVKLPGRNAKTATISPYYVTEPHRQSHEGGVRASFRFGEVFDFDD